jgi:hypothetical protein
VTKTLGELALIGTSRIETPSATGTPVDAMIDVARQPDVAQRVLLLAAALDAYQRAGVIPVRVATLPEPAPIDPRPACSAAVAQILAEMLAGGHHELLPEAFELIAQAAQRLPEALLPACLDLKEPHLRQSAQPVLGDRGHWLARQRDRWSWAAVGSEIAPAETAADLAALRRTWEEGAMQPRLDAVTRLRASHPAAAREWIAEAWTREPVEIRVRLLAIMQTALAPEDEPWLESILKDRSAAVRARSALLLTRLTESAFAARARTRVEPLLAWDRSDASASAAPPPSSASPLVPASGRARASFRARLEASGGGAAGADLEPGTLRVSPPMQADPAWEEEGMSLKPFKGQGERSMWLMQLLMQVHPSFWSGRFARSPRGLVRAAWRTEWGSAINAGWSQAIRHLGDPDGAWSVALWDGWANDVPAQDAMAQTIRGEMLALLFASMPADAAEERLIELLRPQPPMSLPPSPLPPSPLPSSPRPSSSLPPSSLPPSPLPLSPLSSLPSVSPSSVSLPSVSLPPLSALPFDPASAMKRFDTRWSDRLASVVLAAIARAPQAPLLIAASALLPASHFERGLTIAGEQESATIAGGVAWRRALDLFITRIRLRQRLFQELAR